MSDPVSWEVVERVARQALRFTPELDYATKRRLEEDFSTFTPKAEALVSEMTGLVAAGGTEAKVVDRLGWVESNIASFQRLLQPLGERLTKESSPLQRALGPGGKAVAGLEVGGMLAWISSRVLGQFDLFPGDEPSEGGRIYYVGPNIVALERRHAFPPNEFRLWIALHEVTHRLQFSGVSWMREYFLDLVERGTDLDPPGGKQLLDALTHAVAELRAGRNPLEEGGVVGLLVSSEHLEVLREAQALMSLLEGHADVVMSNAGRELVPGAKRFAEVLSKRRTQSRGVGRVVQQALGIEAKLRQYAEGERFVEKVTTEGGTELFSRVWESPQMLPSIAEIRDPLVWVRRAEGAARPALS